jgi:hypothetical protein
VQPDARARANKCKQTKINVSKIAFFYFLLLTFIFSNPDFSMGYGQFPALFSGCVQHVSDGLFSPFPRGARRQAWSVPGGRVVIADDDSVGFCFAQENV